MKLKRKLIIAATSSLTISAMVATLAVATHDNIKQDKKLLSLNSANSAKTTTVEFTKGTWDCKIVGQASVKIKVGRKLCTITKPNVVHVNNWRFKGWSINGTDPVNDGMVVNEKLTLVPIFEVPQSIANCLGFSAVETTTVTVDFGTDDATKIPDLKYTLNFGEKWYTLAPTNGTKAELSLKDGSCLYFKGSNLTKGFSQSPTQYVHFDFNSKVNVFGNVLSLLNDGDFDEANPTPIPNSYCFYHLFENCTNILNVAHDFLPSTTLKDHCYEGMFKGCTNVNHIPRLPAGNTTVGQSAGCYKELFYQCSNINYISTSFTGNFSDTTYSSCFENWVYGVASSGTIIYGGSETTQSSSAVPTGWNISKVPNKVVITADESATCVTDHEYKFTAKCYIDNTEVVAQDVLWTTSDASVATIDSDGKLLGRQISESKTITITAYAKANYEAFGTIQVTITPASLERCTKMTAGTTDATFSWSYSGSGIGPSKTTPNFKYSNDGINWTEAVMDSEITIGANKSIYIKGNNPYGLSAGDETSYTTLHINSGTVSIDGSARGLLFDGRDDKDSAAIPCDFCFSHLFTGSNVTSVSDDYLPFTTITKGCYSHMFYKCSSLTKAPKLPADTLADYCYQWMFRECTSLLAIPDLNAMNLAEGCYYRMCYGCTSIAKTPALPATTPKPYCYYMTFQDCTSVKQFGLVSLTKLDTACCYQTFRIVNIKNVVNTSSGTLFFTCPSDGYSENNVKSMFASTGVGGLGTPKSGTKYYYK